MSWLRIIGDVHGYHEKLVNLCNEAEYSLCVGDIGFSYNYLKVNLGLNSYLLGGNHDNYTRKTCCNGCDVCEKRGYTFPLQTKHFLKDYGILEIPEFKPIFYVRGAWSIDRDFRIAGVSWWEDEELTYQQCVHAIEKYEEIKPEFVVTHTCPRNVIPYIPFNSEFGDKIYQTRTEQMLENMYEIHQPKIWIFGHFHKTWNKEFVHPSSSKITNFFCLGELDYLDFNKE